MKLDDDLIDHFREQIVMWHNEEHPDTQILRDNLFGTGEEYVPCDYFGHIMAYPREKAPGRIMFRGKRQAYLRRAAFLADVVVTLQANGRPDFSWMTRRQIVFFHLLRRHYDRTGSLI